MQILDGKLIAAVALIFLLWLVASVLTQRPRRSVVVEPALVTSTPDESSAVPPPADAPPPESSSASNETGTSTSTPNPDVQSPFKTDPSKPSGESNDGGSKS